MGTRRKGKAVEIKLLIPEVLYLRFEQQLTNNFRHKPQYGLRSQLVSELINQWVTAQEANQEKNNG